MTDNQKFITGVAIGAAAGAAIALFLSSEKGRALLADVKDMAANTSDDLKETISGWENTVKNLVKKGREFMSDVTENPEEAEESYS